MKTISIPTNNRLDLLMRCIGSLQAAHGIEGWALVFSCEPCQPVTDYISRLSFAPLYFHRNQVQMGCWVNTFLAANFAMSIGSELNLYLEDDIIVSPDALILADQFASTRFDVLALRRPEATLTPNTAFATRFDGGLFGDGFAWRKATWPILRSMWFGTDVRGQLSMWDLAAEQGMKQKRMSQVRPCVNRSQNIGLVGTHQHGYDPNRHSPCYSGPPVQKFNFT